MKYRRTHKSRLTLILVISLFSTACHVSSKENGETTTYSLGVTPISTGSVSYTSFVESVVVSSEKSTEKYSGDLFADDFFIIDNSRKNASIYEIEVATPMSWSEPWLRSHGSAFTFEPVCTLHWSVDYYSNYAARWYLGSPFVYNSSTDHQSQNHSPDDSSQAIYSPPAGTTVNTTKSIRAIPIGSIPNYEELPINVINGHINPESKVICLELDTSAFPMETGYLSSTYDTYNLIGIAENYLDEIPVGGAMSVVALVSGDYVYEYDELVGPTRGGALIMQDSPLSRNENSLVSIYQTKEFCVKEVVYSNLPIKPVLECKDEILKAFDYSPLVCSSEGIQFYAAELAYMPLSDFDLKEKDYISSGHTYLIPVWNVFFRSSYDDGGIPGTGCVTIGAISGKSLYSEEYPYQDSRVYSDEI